MSTQELSEKDLAEISFFAEVAQIHGSYLSLKDIASVIGTQLSDEEFERAWQSNPVLSGKFVTDSGLVIPRKGSNSRSISEIFSLESERKRYAGELLLRAKGFAAFSRSDIIKHLSVSGSVSYGSTLQNDDLDFFVITASGVAWIYIFRTLLLAKVYRWVHGDSPMLCLSCVMDEDYAIRRFESERDALFARDALNVESIYGSDYYQGLLERANWIAELFPKLYDRRVRGKRFDERPRERDPSLLARATNLFFYLTLGRYLGLKAFLLNQRYLKKGLFRSLFMTIMSADHCIYESAHYSSLRTKYREIRPTLLIRTQYESRGNLRLESASELD